MKTYSKIAGVILTLAGIAAFTGVIAGIINSNDIYWFDDQSGEHKIEMKLISKVEISEKEICIKILESNTKINLEEMSLIVFKSKIQEVLTNYIGKEKIIVLDK